MRQVSKPLSYAEGILKISCRSTWALDDGWGKCQKILVYLLIACIVLVRLKTVQKKDFRNRKSCFFWMHASSRPVKKTIVKDLKKENITFAHYSTVAHRWHFRCATFFLEKRWAIIFPDSYKWRERVLDSYNKRERVPDSYKSRECVLDSYTKL